MADYPHYGGLVTQIETLTFYALFYLFLFKKLQSNLFNTDTKGTDPRVRFTEVSVL